MARLLYPDKVAFPPAKQRKTPAADQQARRFNLREADITCNLIQSEVKYPTDTLDFYILRYPLVIVNQVLVEFVMMDMVFIPERLKEIREDRNLSKAAAARLLNLSKMGYLRYETGERTPSYQTIVFMAQKLGTSPEYLTGKENTPEPREYIISKTDDSELFALIQDMMDTKNPARTRLLAYYKELKASAMK